jgi:S-adenosylmethionine decarboxylase
MSFGPHLTIDGKGCDFDKLRDINLVYKALNELPDLIGMTKMTLPYVVPWKDKGSEIPGVSGFVMIAESHISIHTFPEEDYLFIDIFSCREFNTDLTIKYFKELFGIKKMSLNVVKRGLDFPRKKIKAEVVVKK